MTSRGAKQALREFAMNFPGAYEEFPWGESVIKVNKKVFVFLGAVEDFDKGVNFTVKLPVSGDDALNFPFTRPSGYNLGKSGWVTVRFPPDEEPPVDLFERWIEESYRAVAPKKLIERLKR
jgi:predicted DNA-binding protein (MmcQ/YjbR family)